MSYPVAMLPPRSGRRYERFRFVRRHGRLPLGAALVLAALLLSPAEGAAHDKPQSKPPSNEQLPPPPVRMRLVAPSASGPWLLRIDNEGDEPVRIPADARLLSLEIRPLKDSKWAHRAVLCDGPKAFGLQQSFPYPRELLLKPGHSYVEQLDPRLICFGELAKALAPGSLVKAYLGWPPKASWSRGPEQEPFAADATLRPRHYRPLRRLASPTMQLSYAPPARFPTIPAPSQAPVHQPAEQAPSEQQHEAHGSGDHAPGEPQPDQPQPDQPQPGKPQPGQPQPGKPQPGQQAGSPAGQAPDTKPSAQAAAPPPPNQKPFTAEDATRNEPDRRPRRQRREPLDELAAHLTLTTSQYADAERPGEILISVQAHNNGERDIFVALRARQLSFAVAGPDGLKQCPAQSADHMVPRDLFRTLTHGKHIHMSVLLGEICPPDTFQRGGLYVATPTLHANDSGKRYGFNAMTGKVTVRSHGEVGGRHDRHDDAALIRLRGGQKPFYRDPPRQIPTRIAPDQGEPAEPAQPEGGSEADQPPADQPPADQPPADKQRS